MTLLVDLAGLDEPARRRATTNVVNKRAWREWDERHGKHVNPSVFEREILPAIQGVPRSQLQRATGLSLHYVLLIRRGEKTPHPRSVNLPTLRRPGRARRNPETVPSLLGTSVVSGLPVPDSCHARSVDQVSVFRLRLGVALIGIWWIPIWLLAPLVAHYLDQDAGSVAITVAIVQTIIGLIGVLLAGRQAAKIVRRTGFRAVPAKIGHVLWTGRLTEPEPTDATDSEPWTSSLPET
jgi:hypothetical protein